MFDKEDKEKLEAIANEVTESILNRCKKVIESEVTKLLHTCWKATEALMQEALSDDPGPEDREGEPNADDIKKVARVKIETDGLDLSEEERMELANFIAGLVMKKSEEPDETPDEDSEEDGDDPEDDDEDAGVATIEARGVKISIG